MEKERKRAQRQALLEQREPTESTLVFWIKSVLGIWIPVFPVCSEHCSPYEYFHDRYFDKYNKTIAWAARSGGKSYMTGLECWLKARFRPKWEAMITGGSKQQSRMSYKATSDFWDITDDIDGRSVLVKEPLMDRTLFKNGSSYSISAAGEKSVRGEHPNQNFLDEIDEMEFVVYDAVVKQPQSKHGHRANWALTSTMHKAGGIMENTIDNAAVQGYQVYTWCILEVMEGCYDYSCSRCPLSEWCQGQMKEAMKRAEKFERGNSKEKIKKGQPAKMGFNPVQDVIDKVQLGEMEDESGEIEPIDIEADLFCRRPSRSGRVYPDFDELTHVVENFEIPPTWRRYRAIDFGYENPYAVLYIAVDPSDRIFIYRELYERHKTNPQMAALMTDGFDQSNFEWSIADRANPSDIRELNDYGIATGAAESSLKDRKRLRRNTIMPVMPSDTG